MHKYETDGTFVTAFCDRKGVHDLALRSGNFGWLATDVRGYLYYTLPYPYEIRKFSAEGLLIDRFTRPTPSFREPFIKRQEPRDKVLMASGTMDLLILPTGIIIHVVYHRKSFSKHAYPDLYLDVFSPDGDWLLNVPLSNVGLDKYGPMAVANDGFFYVGQADPYPRVVKYSLSIVDTQHE